MKERGDKEEGGNKGERDKSVLSVGWRNTAWLTAVNTEPVTTTTNHRLSHTRRQNAKPRGHTVTH